MNSPFYFLLQQFAYSSPQLLLYLVGLVLGIIFLRKYGTSAMLVLCGSVVLLVTTIGQTLLQYYLFRARVDSGWSQASYAQILSVVNLGASLLRALALALWLAAVFVGRRSKAVI